MTLWLDGQAQLRSEALPLAQRVCPKASFSNILSLARKRAQSVSLQHSVQTSFDILSGVGSGQFGPIAIFFTASFTIQRSLFLWQFMFSPPVQAADSGFQVYVYAPRNLVCKQVCFRSLFKREIEVQYIGDSLQSVRIIHYQLFLFKCSASLDSISSFFACTTQNDFSFPYFNEWIYLAVK